MSERAVRPESAAPAAVRVLAIADTDSYLKWSAATLDALPHSWESSQLLIRNPVMPSEAQIRAASSRRVEVMSFRALVRRIRRECPDVVLLACTGPVVAALTDHRVFWRRNRPVLITGLPGISLPATKRAVAARAACDLFVVHSKREIAEFGAFAASQAPRLACGLASLPFLLNRSPMRAADSAHQHHLLFAAQAKVPAERVHREQILIALADAGSAVVKLRAWSEEQQTHNETWSYPKIMEDLVEQRRVSSGAVAFVGGSMHDALRRARGLVTVSSTAALEAIAMNRPILIISDFGVSAEMINVVFEGSGCLGTLDDLRSGRFFRPDPRWLEINYFHRVAENDWLERVCDLLAVRAGSQLPGRPRLHASLRQRVRQRVRLIFPVRLWRRLTKYRILAAKRGVDGLRGILLRPNQPIFLHRPPK
ncbi:MAG TPA: DUF6716 putative glycosyltransferase [Propionibacteriaceae bacterium]|nr:DUF6716 putative glycosyltransferase [Propionibacteriaceae bacterium]